MLVRESLMMMAPRSAPEYRVHKKNRRVSAEYAARENIRRRRMRRIGDGISAVRIHFPFVSRPPLTLFVGSSRELTLPRVNPGNSFQGPGCISVLRKTLIAWFGLGVRRRQFHVEGQQPSGNRKPLFTF